MVCCVWVCLELMLATCPSTSLITATIWLLALEQVKHIISKVAKHSFLYMYNRSRLYMHLDGMGNKGM